MTPILFVHIPKTAGISIRKALSDAGVPEHPLGESSARFTTHISAEAYRRYYGDNYRKLRTFAVVRNPFDWLRSFYRFIKFSTTHPVTGKSWRHQIHERVKLLDFSDFVDFACVDDGFSQLFDAKKLRAVGIPQFTQAAFVSDPSGRIIVRSIFRFERLQDLPVWLLSLGIDVPGLALLNVSRKASTDETYTARMRSLVEQRFAADFDLWESPL